MKEEDEALTLLLKAALRMRAALKFYASPDNYIDGVPMIGDVESGMLEHPDNGLMARKALRLDDYVTGNPIVRRLLEEGKQDVAV